jgi:hypothetical protein
MACRSGLLHGARDQAGDLAFPRPLAHQQELVCSVCSVCSRVCSVLHHACVCIDDSMRVRASIVNTPDRLGSGAQQAAAGENAGPRYGHPLRPDACLSDNRLPSTANPFLTSACCPVLPAFLKSCSYLVHVPPVLRSLQNRRPRSQRTFTLKLRGVTRSTSA